MRKPGRHQIRIELGRYIFFSTIFHSACWSIILPANLVLVKAGARWSRGKYKWFSFYFMWIFIVWFETSKSWKKKVFFSKLNSNGMGTQGHLEHAGRADSTKFSKIFFSSTDFTPIEYTWPFCQFFRLLSLQTQTELAKKREPKIWIVPKPFVKFFRSFYASSGYVFISFLPNWNK